METALKEGKYLYCIIRSSGQRTFGPLGMGDRGDELRTVCFNDIAAVTSDSPVIKYCLSRQNLLQHEKAIEEVMKVCAVLPVRFCTIAEDENTVKKILEKECGNFTDLLDRIEGKKEFGLKAIFKEDIYDYILDKYEGIKALKARIAGLSFQKSYFQRVEIGRLVEDALQAEKRSRKEAILNNLSLLASQVKLNDAYGEKMIVNAAFLVDQTREAAFDREVTELDAKYGSMISFKYVTTVPPFNFVNLVIDTSVGYGPVGGRRRAQ